MPSVTTEEQLVPTICTRVHRSAIVRADQFMHLLVVGDGSYLLTLRCGDELIVSVRYVAIVRERLQLSSFS